jgi:hypothetical protein
VIGYPATGVHTSVDFCVFRPESRTEFLDATPEDAHEDALFVWRGRKVAVAIDLGHAAAPQSLSLQDFQRYS